MHSEQALRPARPSLLDQLAHAGLMRAFAVARENGVRPLCLDGTAGNGHDTLFLAETAPEGAGAGGACRRVPGRVTSARALHGIAYFCRKEKPG